jgi:plasmid stability protein
MAVLTIRNVPDDVYALLRERATAQRRSINSEAIECLRIALTRRTERDVEGYLSRARAVRERLAARRVSMSNAELSAAKREGRR